MSNKQRPQGSRLFRDSSFSSPHCNFSQPRTYARAIRKKMIVKAIQSRSNIVPPDYLLKRPWGPFVATESASVLFVFSTAGWRQILRHHWSKTCHPSRFRTYGTASCPLGGV